MMRPLFVLIAAICLVASTSCQKQAEVAPYDNTAERAAFQGRYNAQVLESLRKQKKELETALAGDASEEDRKEKQSQLESVSQRLQRPAFFEQLTETDLPTDLKWEDGQGEPELGSPKAKKGGTFHSYIIGGAYPPTIRCVGKEANNSFRSNHWDDIELALTGFHPDTGKIIPGLADKWAVAEDGQTVYFHIDKDARWSDGEKVKSSDWLMSFYVYLSPYLSESFYRTYYGDQYWGVATYGDDYLCIRLSTPKPLAPGFAGGIYPFQENFYREFGPDFESRYNWRPRPTTGAYQILEKDIQKMRSIAVTRVKDWWAKDKKYYRYRFNADRIEYLQIRDEEKIFQLFLRGDIDTYLLSDPKKWYEKTEIPNVFNGYIEKATFYNQFPAVSRGLYLNLSRPLLSDLNVRIGLQYASNFDKVIEFDLRGDAQRLNLIADGYGEFSNPNIRTRPFSIQLARESFAKAGFTKTGSDGVLENGQGQRLSFTITYAKNPSLEPALLRLKEEARKAGVEYKLEGMDPTAAFQKITRKEHEIAFTGWQAQPPFPDYYQGFHSKDAYEPGTKKPRPMTNNITIFADPEVDRLSEAIRSARSTEEIRAASWRIEEILHERAVWVPAWYRPFYRFGYWRWVRWPESFNVRLGNEPEMNYVYWIDTDIKKETEEAMRDHKIFPEQNLIFDQYRVKPPEK